MCGIIYKITNTINGKVYIGLTTTTLNKRWNGHKTCARKAMNNEKIHPLYCAMAKYGIDNFKIEEIDSSDNFINLGKLERMYISKYNSSNREFGYNITRGGESNQLDANPRANLTVRDVEKIREIYNECKIGPIECWETYYKDKISYSAFEKIYEGTTWTSIMPDVYTLENKTKHRKMCVSPGEKNGNAKFTNEEVYEIRKYYVNHTLKECYEKYGEKSSSITAFRFIIDNGYKSVPTYSKVKKMWVTGEHEKRVQIKSNEIVKHDDILEIHTVDDYGKPNGVFITDLKFYDIVANNKWYKFINGKIYTRTKEKPVVFLHELIMKNTDGRVYYINSNPYDVREKNLTNSIAEYKIAEYGIDNFKELCFDKNVSLREIGRRLGLSASRVKKYIDDNNILISDNKHK